MPYGSFPEPHSPPPPAANGFGSSIGPGPPQIAPDGQRIRADGWGQASGEDCRHVMSRVKPHTICSVGHRMAKDGRHVMGTDTKHWIGSVGHWMATDGRHAIETENRHLTGVVTGHVIGLVLIL